MNLKRVSLCDRVVALRNSVFILPVVVAFLSSSCSKESSLLGLNFVPPGDKIQTFYTDTITVYSTLVSLDSVASYYMGNALFGSYFDPIFGIATANVVTQVSWYSPSFRFGTNPVSDSVVMRIKYEVIYGDRTKTVHFKVYQLGDNLFNATPMPLYWDSIPYYSNLNIMPYLGEQIGEFSYCPASHPTDSLIRFNLSSAFGTRLVETDTASLDSSKYFHRYIKGICIIPDVATNTGDGYIFKTNLGTDYFDINVYYHSKYAGKDSINTLAFVVSNYNRDARINTFTHDYSSAKFLGSLNKNAIHDTVAYMESMSGVITKLSFPYLASLRGQPSPITNKYPIISINKAELIVPVEPGDTSLYPPAGLMQLLHKRADGNFVTTPDYDFFYATDSLGQAYVGGNYDKYNRNYITNINKHLEYSFSQFGTYNTDLYLRPNSSSQNPFPGRSILKNGTGKNKIKLRITYTKR